MPQAPLSTQSLKLPHPVSLGEHPARVYLDSLSEGSYLAQKGALDAIAALLTEGECDADTLNWSALRYRHTAAIRTALAKRYSPATANRMLCALRRVLKEAQRLDLMDSADYLKASDISLLRENRKLRGRALSSGEIAALIRICQSDPAPGGVRDAALIAILRGTGLRRAEVVKLDLKDYDASGRVIEVRGGKGGKDRRAYLPGSALPLVEN